MRDKLDKHILKFAESAHATGSRNYTVKHHENTDATIQLMENKIELDKVTKVIDYAGYVIEFLIWCRKNLFNASGKLSIPIIKWPSLVKKVKEFITNISNL